MQGPLGCRWAGRAQGVAGGGPFFFHFSPRAAQSSTGFSSFAPRCEPPRARAPGAQMIRMGAGSSPALQRLSRPTIYAILSARVGKSSTTDLLPTLEPHP
eukprot:gene25390-biopygen13514